MAEWISVSQAATFAHYDADYIRKLIRAEKIKARKFVTVWQVDQASLRAYLAQQAKRGERRGPKKQI